MFLSPENCFPIFLLTRPLIFKITFSDKYYVEDPNITYNFIQTRFIATYQNTSHRIALESMKRKWNWYINLPSSNTIQIIDQNNIMQKFNLQNFITRKNITLLAFVLRNNNDVLQNRNLRFDPIEAFVLKINNTHIDGEEDKLIDVEYYNDFLIQDYGVDNYENIKNKNIYMISYVNSLKDVFNYQEGKSNYKGSLYIHESEMPELEIKFAQLPVNQQILILYYEIKHLTIDKIGYLVITNK